MTHRTTDNTDFWRLVTQHLREGVRESYGTAPTVPANLMLKLAERIWRKRCRG
jgi:hypothetical protein